ncbi:MAG: bifunctional oligoribonuclease/PAP phosphatase NrnA [Bacteroidetes bacterium]|nr:bifunctional oligoribonuclease/PAP phosphatase NrnA [Bacteroidota bacterium]
MQALQRVENPKIVITTHHKPDADAMGSSLGLKLFLDTFGYKVDVISPTDYATFLNWMKDCDKVIIFENEPELSKQLALQADFIFCLDFNHLSRINEFGDIVAESKAIKVLIDHHQFPQGFENMTFWDDLASSTCELVYRFIHANKMDDRINQSIAECLYTGIVTDTGSFRFSNTSSETLKIAAGLMEKGINHVNIYDRVFDSFTESRVRFIGYAISQKLEVLHEYNTALITINKDELKRFNVITGDTEGLVNYGLSIEGIKFAALIIDRTKIVKMSFRSKGNFASNNFALQHFNGGGHFYAAGGSSELNLEDTISKFKQTLKIYKAQLNEN